MNRSAGVPAGFRPVHTQSWRGRRRSRNDAQDFLRREFRCPRRRFLAPDAVDLIGGNAERLEEKLVGRSEVAFRVIRRETPLVRPEEMNVPKQKPSGLGQFDCRREELQRDPSAGQGHVMQLAQARGRGNFIQPERRGRSGQFLGGIEAS